MRNKFGRFIKGPSDFKGQKRPTISGENAYQWKGDDIGYRGLHYWIQKIRGKALWCSWCGSCRNIQWANISHEYKRDIYDWLALCVKCHRKHDLGRNDSRILFSLYNNGQAANRKVI